MSRLDEQITSAYIEARNALNSTRAGEITVYVENEDDIPFWKNIFGKHNLTTKIYPASRETLNRGKQEVLKRKNSVGKFLLLCVDSDYDFLLQNQTETSKLINENPYIFQTYTYSIENYKCYAQSLHSVIVNSTFMDEPQLFNYVDFLKKYSSIIYNLFVYSFHYTKIQSNIFTITNFAETIKFLKPVDILTNGENSLHELECAVSKALERLEKLPENKYQSYTVYLSELGVSKENTYLFVKGHVLYENVVLMFLKPIENYLKNLHFKTIEEQKKDKEEAETRRNQYRKLQRNVDVVLSNNFEFDDCFLYKKISKDIADYKKLVVI